ncbi:MULTISPECIES: hypothetical protein [unclassified Candidatus Accumulibacter]|uniref:hypothetical protein n=1 Tax=unclassified Candidatus Accumulibacter TaxID=2619054 RepID=UPI0025C2511D|nr:MULTISPECIES: hypothetical protein [unclassified Candidatus Accumulibacter]
MPSDTPFRSHRIRYGCAMLSAGRKRCPWDCRGLNAAAVAALILLAAGADGSEVPEQSPALGRKAPADAGLTLRLSRELSLPAGRASTSELGRDLLRLQRRTLQMLGDRDHAPQALTEKLVWLEADLAELKRVEARLAAEAGASPATRPAAKSAPPTAAPATAGQRPAEAAVGVEAWALYAALAVLGLLASGWFFRRRRAARQRRASSRQAASEHGGKRATPSRTAREAAASASMAPWGTRE